MSTVSPHTRIALAKYYRELEEAVIDLEAVDHQIDSFLRRTLEEREAARQSLRKALRPLMDSLKNAA